MYQLGKDKDWFLKTTWNEFDRVIRAKFREDLQKWRMVRKVAHTVYTSAGGKMAIESWYPLEGEREKQRDITRDEWDKIKAWHETIS